MKSPPVQKDSNNRLAPFSKGRRFFLGGLATLGAGIAGSAILPKSVMGQPAAEASTNTELVNGGCRRGVIIASDAGTVAETTAGKIRGFKRNGIYIFKGVPYGASTAGPNRFMPPAKPEPWPGIRNALQYGRVCPSQDSAHVNTDGKNLANSDEDAFLLHRGAFATVPGEDCLRLNLWTPEINSSHKRPVMVYMHGGGFAGGSGHDLLSYDGESLARNHDAVVVTHNHRLNVYGYLNLEHLGGERYASAANVGMLDLVAVLEWVRDNIKTFGGDPDCVTIFGQSGGGGKVLALMAMPAAKGLFHRAIVMPPHKSSLREVYGERDWGPTVDGRILPRHPFDPGAPELSAEVPLLTGTNLHEFVSGLDRPDANAMGVEELNRLVSAEFGDRSEAIIGAYRRDYPKATAFGLYAAIAAARVRRPAFEQAIRKAALGGAPGYSYVYSWRTPVLDNRPGPFHACEIAFTFDNAEICDHYSGGTPEAFTLSKRISTAWTNFARSGNPNHNGLPHWPTYTAEHRATMYFDTHCEVRNDAEGEGLRLIAQS